MSEERNKLFKKFLEMYYFNDWKKEEGRSEYETSLVLTVSPTCNTKCSYCYYKNYGDEIYPKGINKSNDIVKNAELLLKWMAENNYKVKNVDIFSGEFFNLPYYKDILDLCKNYFKEINKKGFITIPTNSTFIFDKEKTKEIEETMEDFKKEGIFIILSLSVDGKYLDNNTRAIRNGAYYTDEFYEDLFKFAKKHNLGFHPMVSAEGIKDWKKNYIWYMNNLLNIFENVLEISKRLYLLEVRNPDWKIEDLKHLEDFILFFIEDVFQRVGRDKKVFMENIMLKNGFNLLTSISFSIGRGIGCSEQMDFEVRLGDLAIIPCHRSSYEGFNGGYFKVEDGKIVDIISENPETYILYKTFSARGATSCSSCVISELCSFYCMGANMEVNKDFFTPIETVCRLEFVKAKSLIKGFMNIGVLDNIIGVIEKNSGEEFKKKKAQMLFLKNIIEKEAKESGFYKG